MHHEPHPTQPGPDREGISSDQPGDEGYHDETYDTNGHRAWWSRPVVLLSAIYLTKWLCGIMAEPTSPDPWFDFALGLAHLR